ncbi:MAG: AAA family ATPase, partial [Actinobacteria bacterium]|nr:AAA family ATPase [Actinomycetota bacterium]
MQMDITQLRHGNVVRGNEADTTSTRERQRRRRLRRLLVAIMVPLAWVWYRILTNNPIKFGIPDVVAESPEIWISVGLMFFLCLLIGIPLLGAGRSPHTLLRPSDSNVSLSDVVGASATKREAVDTLNFFLKHQSFADELGGSPRRGVLFEGPPGTGKTYLAKALAAEAGVPFLFVSASSFQSMYYGQTNRKIRTYFKALRKAARA